MKILVVGANGKIGRRAVRLLARTEHQVRAMVRDPAQVEGMRELGAEPVVADLEQELAPPLQGCDAVVFTAGSGPHTGPEKTVDVDQEAAIRLIVLAESMGVDRFVMISAMRTENPQEAPEKLRHYLGAKKLADDRLKASRLNYTILRPGRLTDEAGTGRVALGERTGYGEIPREDVAAVILEVIDEPNTYRRELELRSGETRIGDALAAL